MKQSKKVGKKSKSRKTTSTAKLSELDAAISKINVSDKTTFLLIRLGNDHFPELDTKALAKAAKTITSMLAKIGVNVPVLVWNHAIDIQPVQVGQ